MNNTALIKLIAQYVNMRHEIPKVIKGFEKSRVLETVNDMINKKVIFEAEIKIAPWNTDPYNQSTKYKKTEFYINKELIKTEYGEDKTK